MAKDNSRSLRSLRAESNFGNLCHASKLRFLKLSYKAKSKNFGNHSQKYFPKFVKRACRI